MESLWELGGIVGKVGQICRRWDYGRAVGFMGGMWDYGR